MNSLAPQWVLLSVLILASLTTSASPTSPPHRVPRLGAHPKLRRSAAHTRTLRRPAAASVSEDFETFFYNQTLDHFNFRPESYSTFQQKYVINSKYWGGANESAPIFVYLGAEGPIDDDVDYIGFIRENAPGFKALTVFIEHRFYGKSIPFGSEEEAMKNNDTRGYFNSAQAIADYAEVIRFLKEKLSAQNSPVIVIGASYGGMLASWFRLKYPHIALGALASSAPILYFDDIIPQNGYYSVVTKDFKDASESCYETIRKSWSEIDNVAAKPNGLSILSKRFKTCAKLSESSALKDYLDTLYSSAAQYNYDPSSNIVDKVCAGIDGAPEGTDILGRIFAGMVAYAGDSSCYNSTEYSIDTYDGYNGWSWQECSEIVSPVGRGSNDTMFQAQPFVLKDYIDECTSVYGVPPRPHWATTYYGGQDIKLVLKRFASNIIFSNGLKDPWSSGGVLEDISDSVLAVYTANGSHCLDVDLSAESDPQWLTMQRRQEVKIVKGWLKKYYADLRAYKQTGSALRLTWPSASFQIWSLFLIFIVVFKN